MSSVTWRAICDPMRWRGSEAWCPYQTRRLRPERWNGTWGPTGLAPAASKTIPGSRSLRFGFPRGEGEGR